MSGDTAVLVLFSFTSLCYYKIFRVGIHGTPLEREPLSYKKYRASYKGASVFPLKLNCLLRVTGQGCFNYSPNSGY